MSTPSSLDAFCDWLKTTHLSDTLQTVEWLIPAIQTVHILGIAAVVAAAQAVTLRAVGLSRADQPLQAVSLRFLPIIWWTLPILLVTGALLIIAEPARALENPVFYLKMGLLVLAMATTAIHQAPLRKNPEFWEGTNTKKRIGRGLLLASFVVWAGIVFAGRWIAYIDSL